MRKAFNTSLSLVQFHSQKSQLRDKCKSNQYNNNNTTITRSVQTYHFLLNILLEHFHLMLPFLLVNGLMLMCPCEFCRRYYFAVNDKDSSVDCFTNTCARKSPSCQRLLLWKRGGNSLEIKSFSCLF